MEILRKTDKLILDMKTNDSLRKTILKNAKDNRIFMSWLIFEASTWTNYGLSCCIWKKQSVCIQCG